MLERVVYGDVTVLNLTVAAGIVVVALIIARFTTTYLRRVLSDRTTRDQRETVIKSINYTVILITIPVVLKYLGFNLSGFLIAGGIAGVVIGFASQNIISNLISGFFLMTERPIKIGDEVDIAGDMGFVEDISIISTKIRTYDGLYVRIPNEKVFTNKIINYVNHVARRFEFRVGIRYSDDASKAKSIISRVIDDHQYALKKPKPQVFVHELGDNAVIILVRVWAPVSVWYEVKMELLIKFKNALSKEGIEIAFPQRVVWMGDREKLENTESTEQPQE